MKGVNRDVARIIKPRPTIEGAGVRLKRAFPLPDLDYLDPFLLLDHFGSENPEDYLAGFPLHPHRGIETVTYVLAGVVRHEDTLGNAGVIGAGDVQWMTSGRGIMHEEMPGPVGGRMMGFQLWVNLPARLKMTSPGYQEIPSHIIPLVTRESSSVRVIAGELEGVVGPVKGIAANPLYLDISMPEGASYSQPIQRDHTAFAYVFEGEADFAGPSGHPGTRVSSPALVVLGDGDFLSVRAHSGPARLILVAGKPLHEPIARYGPFVMNTREEILQALEDLRTGRFVVPG